MTTTTPTSFEVTATTMDDRCPWLERSCVVVPALDAERTIASVIEEVAREIPERKDAIFVVDDGSTDRTAAIAAELGCTVLSSSPTKQNVGKGGALLAGFKAAHARGMTVAITVDADGQHPAAEARRLLDLRSAREDAFVLGIRDLVAAGAPRANQISNRISNGFLSRFAGRPLRDTQCGLRRYPIAKTLALSARGRGYDFEAEILLRAVWAEWPIVEEPIVVRYPDDRRTHFHVVRDPWRIVQTIVAALGDRWLSPHAP